MPDLRIEVDDVVARLIAVDILADKTRDIYHASRSFHRVGLQEKRIELPDKCFASAHRAHKPLRILHHVPCVLERVAFGEVVGKVGSMPKGIRIVRFAPVPLRVLAAHKAN